MSAPVNVMPASDWRDYLASKLAERQPRTTLYNDYYIGDHRMAYATAKFKEAFGNLFGAFADNWCGLVVDVAVDRMEVQGFRFQGSTDNDDEAWSIWQANRLDAASVMAHTEAIKAEVSYAIVGPPPKGEDLPKITIEHPSQVIVEHDPADRATRLAALKHYVDARGNVIDVVYEPNRITSFKLDRYASVPLRHPGFYLPPSVSLGGEVTSVTPNPLGVVPVVPIENNPDMLTGGVSDLRPAISLNDAANKFFSDMLIGSEYQAFPQRVLTGVEVPEDPQTGEPITDIEMAVSRLMVFPAPDAKAHSFDAADLGNYVQAIELAVQHLAAQTRTPPHYLLAKLINLSGDALKAAESGLVARVRRKFVDMSDSWEDAMRLAFAWRAWRHQEDSRETGSVDADQRRSEDMEVQTDWANPETQATGLMADSLVKKDQIGWPRTMLWREGGMSDQDIKRAELLMDEQRDEEGPTKEELERIVVMHDQLGIPYEILWKKYLGLSDAEIKEALRLGPLPRGGPGARRPQNPNGQPQPVEPAREAPALTRGGGRDG